MNRSLTGLLLASLLATGCAPNLGLIHEWDNGDEQPSVDTADTGFVNSGPKVTTRPEGNGLTFTEVDAQNGLAWVAIDLDAGATEEVPDTGSDWDLKFQRFEIAVNGGVTGDGGVQAVFFEDQDIAAVDAVPTEGWGTDEPDGDDDNDKPDYVFRPWFDYDGETHIVTANDGTFVVRSTAGRHYAVALQSYYDAAGTSAIISFLWKEL
jgi:hypothetical protein